MTNQGKQLSSSSLTGHRGAHFEDDVLASYVTLMITDGYAPCLPCWPIIKIQPQAKFCGYQTDDLIVFVKNPYSEETCKLLGQVKHGLQIGNNVTFREVIQAAWADYHNSELFCKKRDVIAAISDDLSSSDLAAVRAILSEAQLSSTDDFLKRIELAHFHSNTTRRKLEIFRETLKEANGNQPLQDSEVHEFLRHFRLIGYDLSSEEGVVLSLLHSHISQRSHRPPKDLWGRILDFAEKCNHNARPISKDNIPSDLLEAFTSRYMELPPEIAKNLAPARIAEPERYAYNANFAQAFLIGSWREDHVGDISVLSEFSQKEYETWILGIREVLEQNFTFLELRNGVWRIKRSLKILELLGKKIYDDDLDRFKDVAVKVLSEADPAFELPVEERYMASVYDKSPRYSENIREGIAEGLAIMGSFPKIFQYCTDNKAEGIANIVVRQILNGVDWQRWGSLNDQLPLLAEAAPKIFLDAVENALKQSPCPFLELFAQEGIGIMGKNYMTGLLWALETLAWDEQFLTRVTVILGKLSSIDPGGNWSNRSSNSLTTIFLPWSPQTMASREKQLVAIKTLINEVSKSTAWQILISLLPSQHQLSTGSHKPRWRMDVLQERRGNPKKEEEYWNQVTHYADLALEVAEGDSSRLRILIDLMDNLPPSTFDNLLRHLKSETITNLPEEERTLLWSSLLDFTAKHRHFSSASWALKEDKLSLIDNVTEKLVPQNLENLYRRLFQENSVTLYEGNEEDDWRVRENSLKERRQQAIKKIYKKGDIDAVLEFVKTVDRPYDVGTSFGLIADKNVDAVLLPNELNSKSKNISHFISNYILVRHRKEGWNWVDNIISSKWDLEQLLYFFQSLPLCADTWERTQKLLGDNERLYWKQVYFNAFLAKDDVDIAVDKLLTYGRPNAAISCFYILSKKSNLDPVKAAQALIEAIRTDEPPSSSDTYQTVEVIKALQNNLRTDQDVLVQIEWNYLNLLNSRYKARPMILERTLATDPQFFSMLIQKIYRSQHDENREEESSEDESRFARHAFRLLYEWKTPPGTTDNGSFSSEVFNAWLEQVTDICNETGHFEVAMSHFGQVLIHAPADPNGLWIHATVAEALNADGADIMREGFRVGLSNSRGVHIVKPSGEPEDELSKRYANLAEEAEQAGYFRLATTMRDLERSYKRDAERIRKEHGFDNC